MGEKTNKMTVFLVSEDAKDVDNIIEPGVQEIKIDGIGNFFSADSSVYQPDWVEDFFGDHIGDKFRIRTASSRGLLLVPIEDGSAKRFFAVSFGHGRHYLREGVIDDRFGLKVVLNTVERNSLRSIDKTALGSLPKQSREQMSGEGEFANFGVDIEQDLVNSVTGRSKDKRLGNVITGKDALSLSAKVDLSNIKEFLPFLLDRFNSKDYEAEFDWIDQIKDVRNAKLAAKLDAWLLVTLRSTDHSKVWMAPPAVLDWVDVRGFTYSSAKKATMFEDMMLADLLVQFHGHEISLEGLRAKRVFLRSAKSDAVSASWGAYRCLYAEAEIDGTTYILNNGRWYEIAKGFAAQVLKEFKAFPAATINLPNYNHANEGAYNLAVPAVLDGSVCLDEQLISHGGGRSKIEFCDIKTGGGELVHVKHYGGSAQLSHLFNQGVVSAELYLQDPEFRAKLNNILPEAHKLADPSAKPNPADHEVVFAIISQSKNALEIPFFSKVSLRNARRRLMAYGYKVSVAKIGHAA
ncbi:hypothetical protein EOA85_03040 [Mesorhizobium sp. M5C.F.Ca.IN.020.29.1.1]|uniref:TIGR04141 family sporadically distributed protein n=1 Tax=Mesorhizobium sp. M5C.F.Ca.IN.020.29.1.1 TaxID=2496770 RepID=UPI000FCA0458|nr:TIGR04141 family sporadically distributed protein [Mesorhizobium sp. M5C.F.Ca.IN.020.29.1.1]RUV63773.1 hypothetical protein EOA85_03040 [Mesorhizobium sp. M5C.F.Ca.IN.020.29.1.1]TJW49621.1 MAG: hypothetical protein E5X65_32615 [Mesorhizobium sp.]